MRSFIKTLLIGLLAVVALFAIAFEFSLINTPEQIPIQTQTTHAKQETVYSYLESLKPLLATLCDWFGSWTDKGINTASNVLIALFTFVLAGVSIQQGRTARRDFIATHRPRVIVRFIQGPLLNEKGFQTAWITIVNTGETPAIVDAIGSGFVFREKGKDFGPPGVDASAKPIPPIVLESGKRHWFEAPSTVSPSAFEAAFGNREFCVLGEIQYRDRNGVRRETGFFRTYKESSGQFIAAKDDESEYQD